MYNYFAAIWEKKSLCTICDAANVVYFMVDRIIWLFIILEEQFEKEFSEKEKAKLYKAIGYQENEVDPALPREVSVNRYHTDIKQISYIIQIPDISYTVKSILYVST